MRILIAPNAFKNSLSAALAAQAIATGIRQSELQCTCTLFPVGDGGDGTAALLTAQLGGESISAVSHDALGREIEASFGLIGAGRTAMVELAEASGLRRLSRDELEPLRATSFGTGELILAAVDRGARTMVLAVGGSATTDAATGLLHAFGVRFLDSAGNRLTQIPAELDQLASIDCRALDSRIAQATFTVLCDVDNILLGPRGAAAIFAPQKGASSADVQILEARLARFRDSVLRATGKDIGAVAGGGAAGGAAAGLHGVLGATLSKGIEYFLDATAFDTAIGSADLVITGEGALDEQTLQGKAPYGVAKRAKGRNLPVIGLCGSVPAEASAELRQWFDAMLPISPPGLSTEAALRATAQNLTLTAMQLGNTLAQSGRTALQPGGIRALFASSHALNV